MAIQESFRTNLWSTDSVGAFGSASQTRSVLDGVLQHSQINGLEGFAFRTEQRLSTFIRELENHGVNVLSIHGRTGGHGSSMVDSFKLYGANTSMINSKRLVELHGQDKDILFHAPELRNPKVYREVCETIHTFDEAVRTTVWIENHLGPSALQDVFDVVQALRLEGINAAGLFDPCHFITPEGLSQNFVRNYQFMIDFFNSIASTKDLNGKQIIQALHVPVGTVAHDSLPIEEMSDKQLQQVGDIAAEHNFTRIVIENQQTGVTNIFKLLPYQEAPQRKRNTVNAQRLIATGIIR